MTYTRYTVHYMTKNGMTTYETTSHSVGNWKQAISQARQTMSIPYSTKIGKEDVEEKTESLPEGWDICKRCDTPTPPFAEADIGVGVIYGKQYICENCIAFERDEEDELPFI